MHEVCDRAQRARWDDCGYCALVKVSYKPFEYKSGLRGGGSAS